VAVDRGFGGSLGIETVMDQIRCLPETPNGRKIPVELINENPLPRFPDLLREVARRGDRLSQINLTLRADYLSAGISDHQQSWGYADGPWKGPGPPLLAVADF